MQTLNKKAMSQVVTVLLIAGIGIVAVGIVATVIFNVIDNNDVDLSPEALCLNSEIKIQSACYNEENQEVEITLKRTFPQKNIEGLIFDLVSQTKAESYSCSSDCGDCSVLESGIKTYYIESSQPTSINLKINNCFEKKTITSC